MTKWNEDHKKLLISVAESRGPLVADSIRGAIASALTEIDAQQAAIRKFFDEALEHKKELAERDERGVRILAENVKLSEEISALKSDRSGGGESFNNTVVLQEAEITNLKAVLAERDNEIKGIRSLCDSYRKIAEKRASDLDRNAGVISECDANITKLLKDIAALRSTNILLDRENNLLSRENTTLAGIVAKFHSRDDKPAGGPVTQPQPADPEVLAITDLANQIAGCERELKSYRDDLLAHESRLDSLDQRITDSANQLDTVRLSIQSIELTNYDRTHELRSRIQRVEDCWKEYLDSQDK